MGGIQKEYRTAMSGGTAHHRPAFSGMILIQLTDHLEDRNFSLKGSPATFFIVLMILN